MNRLSPLIVRRVGRHAPTLVWPAPPDLLDDDRIPAWMEDAKLFAVGWVGGLIFFGTFLS